MAFIGRITSAGRLQASVSSPLVGNLAMQSPGPWLIRVSKPSVRPGNPEASDIYAKEAELVKVYRNTGRYKLLDGTTISLELTSDRILGLLRNSTCYAGAFPVGTLPVKQVLTWNENADFRVSELCSHVFEGINLEAFHVYDIRPSHKNDAYYPRYPRFKVGDIAETSYKPDDDVDTVSYGYVRIDGTAEECLFLGSDPLAVIHYTIRRSWRGISNEDWNHHTKMADCDVNGSLTLNMLPTSVQSNIRHQLFDPFYR